MSETINNLVDAIADGNALETENAFAAAMADKLGPKLDAMRQDLAKNMFKSSAEEVEDEQEETVEVDVEVEPEEAEQ